MLDFSKDENWPDIFLNAKRQTEQHSLFIQWAHGPQRPVAIVRCTTGIAWKLPDIRETVGRQSQGRFYGSDNVSNAEFAANKAFPRPLKNWFK